MTPSVRSLYFNIFLEERGQTPARESSASLILTKGGFEGPATGFVITSEANARNRSAAGSRARRAQGPCRRFSSLAQPVGMSRPFRRCPDSALRAGFRGCGRTLPSCHSERSEESRPEYFQGNARFLVACAPRNDMQEGFSRSLFRTARANLKVGATLQLIPFQQFPIRRWRAASETTLDFRPFRANNGIRREGPEDSFPEVKLGQCP